MSENDTGAPQGASQGEPAPTPAPETPAPQSGTEPAADQSPTPAETPEQPPEKRTPWFQTRIDQLTREKHEARREAEALRQALLLRNPAPQDPAQQPTQQPQAANPADIDRIAEAKAAELVRTQQFNAACNAAYDEGVKAFPDFRDALDTLNMVAPLPSRPDVVEAAIATGKGAQVLYELGKDPDTAAHILSLPPIPMAVELAKLASKPAAPKPVSNAPAPIKPVDGAARAEPDPDKMTTKEWMEWRAKQRAKR